MAVARAIEKTSSSAELLTGSKKREIINPISYMRSEGMVHFLIPARFYFYQGLVDTFLIFLKTEIFLSV